MVLRCIIRAVRRGSTQKILISKPTQGSKHSYTIKRLQARAPILNYPGTQRAARKVEVLRQLDLLTALTAQVRSNIAAVRSGWTYRTCLRIDPIARVRSNNAALRTGWTYTSSCLLQILEVNLGVFSRIRRARKCYWRPRIPVLLKLLTDRRQ